MEKRNSLSITSIIRVTKQNKDGEAPVYLRITCDGQRAEVSIRVFVAPSKWQSARGRVRGNSEEARRLNQSIETFEHRAREIYNRFILTGKPITAAGIKKELLGLATPARYLICEFAKFVGEIERKIGNGYSVGTVKNWKVTLGHLQQFVKGLKKVAECTVLEVNGLLTNPIN